MDPLDLQLEPQLRILLANPVMRALLVILMLLLAQLFLHTIIDRVVERAVRSHRYSSKAEERKREATLKKVFRATSGIALWIIGVIYVLWLLRINVGALLTGAGLISVVAGLSAQSVVKDFLSGVFIILENQFRVDDIVTLATPTATVSGVVEDISIRMTRLRDLDGNLHIVSNGQIGVITNSSFQFANINLNIHVTYDTDIDLVEKLIGQAGAATAADPRFQSDIVEPVSFLRVDALGESNVTVKAFGKVRPGTQWAIAGDVRRRLKALFNEHHVAVPYPSAVVQASDGPVKKGR